MGGKKIDKPPHQEAPRVARIKSPRLVIADVLRLIASRLSRPSASLFSMTSSYLAFWFQYAHPRTTIIAPGTPQSKNG